MNAKPDQNTLIAYLYDELDASQKAEVESYLAEHPELSEELRQLEATRNILGNLENVETEIPEFIFPNLPKQIYLSENRSRQQSTFVRNMSVTAAMIAFLWIVGALTGFHISYGDFKLAFGKNDAEIPSVQKPDLPKNTKPDLKNDSDSLSQKIRQEFENEKTALLSKLEALEQKINQSSPTIKPVSVPQTGLKKEELDKLMAGFQEKNFSLMLKLLALAKEDQQKYTDEILTAFARYLEDRREQDLRKIGQNLNNLQINQLKTQQETDRILVKLIETVNLNPNSR